MERLNYILNDEKYLYYLNRNKTFEKGRKFCKHNLKHFLDVARIAQVINLEENMGFEKEIIYVTAILHDIGKSFQYDPDDRSQITILNPSAGEAINLAHHSVMVIYSMNYSYLKWTQFKDRIVVVDTPEVHYHYLMMKSMMDEVVYSAVIEKKKLSDSIMSIYKRHLLGDNNSSETQPLPSLTT